MKSNIFRGLMILSSLLIVTSANAKQRHARAQNRTIRVQEAYSQYGYGGGSSLAGHRCSAADRDPTTCKVCAIYGEDHGSHAGMQAVAGVIQTRVQAGHWGSNPCDVVHARGQFVGAWRTLPNDPALLQAMESAASNSYANGYMGFRSYCKRGRNTRIGGNCYGTASADDRRIVLDPSMTIEDIDAQAMENVQLAEEQGDDSAG